VQMNTPPACSFVSYRPAGSCPYRCKFLCSKYLRLFIGTSYQDNFGRRAVDKTVVGDQPRLPCCPCRRLGAPFVGVFVRCSIDLSERNDYVSETETCSQLEFHIPMSDGS
jgi:hypothetical protein